MRNLAFIALLIFPGMLLAQLRDSSRQADYLLIHPASLTTAAQEHAQWRATKGLSVAAVSVESVMAEFGSGGNPAEAIRGFVSYALTSWRAPRPAFVLLFGDVAAIPTFVEIQTLPSSGEDTALLDMKYVLIESDVDALPDAAIGRFPVSTPEQARNLTAKTRLFEDTLSSASYARDCLLVTDEKNGEIFEQIAEQFATRALPPTARIQRIGLRPGSVHEGTAQDVRDAMAARPMLVAYAGYGSTAQWSNGVVNYENIDLIPFPPEPFITVSFGCPQKWGGFDGVSMTEKFLLLKQGGAVATLGSAGLNYLSSSATVVHTVWSELGAHPAWSIGQALQSAQRTIAMGISSACFALLGDPALRLPRSLVASTSNGHPDINPLSVSVYPNPSRGTMQFVLHGLQGERVDLDVYDNLGRKTASLFSGELHVAETVIRADLRSVPPGVYHFRCTGSSGLQVGTIVIAR